MLDTGEERALLAVAGPQLQCLIIGALQTGHRLGELLRLQWRDVDMDARTLTVRAENTKTRTARIVPMSARLRGVLALRAIDLRFHDLRNEAGSRFVEAGWPLGADDYVSQCDARWFAGRHAPVR